LCGDSACRLNKIYSYDFTSKTSTKIRLLIKYSFLQHVNLVEIKLKYTVDKMSERQRFCKTVTKNTNH
jgi:hypothetical protein